MAEASKSFKTLQSMVDHDVQTNTVRKQGSHSRNLLKIKRGLEFLKVLFEQVILTEYVFLFIGYFYHFLLLIFNLIYTFHMPSLPFNVVLLVRDWHKDKRKQ
jgi:hypothetical protein